LDEGTFDRARFVHALRTRRLGHVLFTRAEVGSTNDVAWELAQQGADEGACVVADAQTRGRGRMNRAWHSAAGQGLGKVEQHYLDEARQMQADGGTYTWRRVVA